MVPLPDPESGASLDAPTLDDFMPATERDFTSTPG